jgi:hypothetical protein
MRETLQNLIQRFQTAKGAWPRVPDTARKQEQVWFAGLAVSPVEFSQQLSNLQLSLQREGREARESREPRDTRVAMPVSVQVRSHPAL